MSTKHALTLRVTPDQLEMLHQCQARRLAVPGARASGCSQRAVLVDALALLNTIESQEDPTCDS